MILQFHIIKISNMHTKPNNSTKKVTSTSDVKPKIFFPRLTGSMKRWLMFLIFLVTSSRTFIASHTWDVTILKAEVVLRLILILRQKENTINSIRLILMLTPLIATENMNILFARLYNPFYLLQQKIWKSCALDFRKQKQ